ncbi:MAG: PDZ domain-containing protein, partial [Xanthomonadaceae bacterium]|nr:PDZ domain-containing protein [Xanthomonadaceae bacterium]
MTLAVGVVLGFGVSVGPAVKAERAVATTQSAPDAGVIPWKDARLLAEVLEHIRDEYVEEITDSELIEAAIRGMMADLDSHSAYLDREQFNEVRISTSGEYSGVGIEVTLDKGVVRVVTPIEGTPAERAGVKAGDTIVSIDGVVVDPQDLDDTIDRMRGAAGTKVSITVAREGEPELLEFEL